MVLAGVRLASACFRNAASRFESVRLGRPDGPICRPSTPWPCA